MEQGSEERLRALVVDESAADCVRLIEAVREIAGERVSVTAETRPDKALARLEQGRFDLVIADAASVPVDGITILAHAWAQDPESHRFLVTAAEPASIILDGLQREIVHAVYRKRGDAEPTFVKDVLTRAGLLAARAGLAE